MVTVIIPCYNSEKTIVNTIKSVENQKHSEIEIICIDDGSTDGTWKLLCSYQKNCRTTIKIIRQQNKGVSAARNSGIENASGRYLFFLDSDDEIFPDTLSFLVKGMKEKEIAYGTWTSERNHQCSTYPISKVAEIRYINDAYMYRKSKLVFASFLYKRSIIIDHNIRFNENLKYGEDNLFLWNYLCFVTKGTEYSTPVYFYNLHDDSAIHNVSWRITDAIEATLKAEKYFEKYHFKYLNDFRKYMTQRTIFYVAKEFAIYGEKNLFERLLGEYNVKANMPSLYNKNGMILTLSAMLLGNIPKLFYGVMRTYGRMLNKKR